MDADPFDLLGVEPRFDLDPAALDERHRELSAVLHPDRHSGRPAQERRMALDKAIAVNAAWRALADPIARAESLLRRHGVAVGERVEPAAAPELLMEMMEAREELAEARDAEAARSAAAPDDAAVDRITAIGERMRARERAVTIRLRRGFEAAGGDRDALSALLPLLGELRYLRRLFEELDAIEDHRLG